MSSPAVLEVGDAAVRVWTVDLDVGGGARARCERLLTDEELARARRFLSPRHTARWTAARAALRTALGAHAGLDPVAVALVEGERGKPRLAVRPGGAPLWFNLSHSDACAMIAVTRLGEVGVDVERARDLDDMEAIAGRFFAPVERATLLGLPAGRRRQAFFECWTRKEALLKATGEGIGDGLDRLAVSFGDGRPARIVRGAGRIAVPAEWSLRALEAPPGYAGALAVHHPEPLRVVQAVLDLEAGAGPGRC